MPESSVRKQAAEKKKVKQHTELVENRREKAKGAPSPASRRWVPWVFTSLLLLGVAWLCTYYVGGAQIPPMAKMGNWNIAIGMGLIAASFGVSTLWE